MAENAKPGILRNLRVKRVALVEAGANFDTRTGDGAHIVLHKSDSVAAVHVDSPDADIDPYEHTEEVGKGVLDAKGRHALPDSAFAAVWTDAKGKHRKLPIHDAGHLAAARGRVDGANIPESVKAAARHKIDAATHKESGVAKQKKTVQDVVKSLVAAFAETDVEKRASLIKAAEEEAGEVGKELPPAAVPGAGTPPPAEHMKAAHEAMGKAIAAFGPGPHPDGHPIHAMKAAHEAMGKACASDEPGALPADGAVAKAISALEKSNKELTAQLVVEKNVRLDREMSDILKSFKATPFVLEGEDSDVASFRKMKETDPAAFERIIAKMRATDAQLAESAIYKNIGSGRTGTGSAYEQLKAKADALISKSTKPLSFAKAFASVCDENPNLVKEYRAQQQ